MIRVITEEVLEPIEDQRDPAITGEIRQRTEETGGITDEIRERIEDERKETRFVSAPMDA